MANKENKKCHLYLESLECNTISKTIKLRALFQGPPCLLSSLVWPY